MGFIFVFDSPLESFVVKANNKQSERGQSMEMRTRHTIPNQGTPQFLHLAKPAESNCSRVCLVVLDAKIYGTASSLWLRIRRARQEAVALTGSRLKYWSARKRPPFICGSPVSRSL